MYYHQTQHIVKHGLYEWLCSGSELHCKRNRYDYKEYVNFGSPNIRAKLLGYEQ